MYTCLSTVAKLCLLPLLGTTECWHTLSTKRRATPYLEWVWFRWPPRRWLCRRLISYLHPESGEYKYVIGRPFMERGRLVRDVGVTSRNLRGVGRWNRMRRIDPTDRHSRRARDDVFTFFSWGAFWKFQESSKSQGRLGWGNILKHWQHQCDDSPQRECFHLDLKLVCYTENSSRNVWIWWRQNSLTL